jgi:polyamine oxidase
VFTQGAYSYHDLSVTDADIEAVSEPINGTLFFAGEHTDPLYYGSLHAAYNSGVRVINNLEKIEL